MKRQHNPGKDSQLRPAWSLRTTRRSAACGALSPGPPQAWAAREMMRADCLCRGHPEAFPPGTLLPPRRPHLQAQCPYPDRKVLSAPTTKPTNPQPSPGGADKKEHKARAGHLHLKAFLRRKHSMQLAQLVFLN